jgi:hypothetical protein
MAERTPLALTLEDFDRARSDDMDGAWAFGVSSNLLMRGVDAALVRSGLVEALELVRQTRESPQELFGSSDDHADLLHDQWLSEGRLVMAADVMPWRQATAHGLAVSGACAAVFSLILVLRDEATAAMLIRFSVISLVIGMGSSLAHAAWQRRHRPRRPAVEAPADLRWSVGLTEILRTRYSLSGSRVRDIVAEAHSHAAEAGRSVQEEFGTPEEYAARFAPDLARRSMLTAVFLGLVALLCAILLVDGLHWSSVGLLVAWGWLAVIEYRKARALRAR